MRKTLLLLCLLAVLAFATPAQAQLRANVGTLSASTKLFESGAAGFVLNKLFSPENFRMAHSYEMSFGSFGGGSSMGMYTNSMMWQFSNKLAARVDLSFVHSPFGGGNTSAFGMQNDNNGRFLVRNAEIAFRPAENIQLNLSFQQSPYGRYMSPMGYYYDSYGRDSFSYHREPLFWKDAPRGR